jgi:hypothetical protein
MTILMARTSRVSVPQRGANFALDKFSISAKDLHDGIDLIPRGRDHRQAVGPASFEVDLD